MDTVTRRLIAHGRRNSAQEAYDKLFAELVLRITNGDTDLRPSAMADLRTLCALHLQLFEPDTPHPTIQALRAEVRHHGDGL